MLGVALALLWCLCWTHVAASTLDGLTFRSARGFASRRSGPTSISSTSSGLVHKGDVRHVTLCSTTSAVAKTLVRGAVLRVASDMTGGTPLESIKCRVAATRMGPMEALQSILQEGGVKALWSGSSSRTIEGALMGALFMLGSTTTKKQVLALGGSKTASALAGGLVGGLAQTLVMTPAGLIFTSLNVNRSRKGYENDNALTVARRILREKGIGGLYGGGGAMAMRQATNWMSRSCFTEIARSTFRMADFGLIGEIGSGVVGGLGSCWNTPIETVRVNVQADVSAGRPPKSFGQYWSTIVREQGYVGLFRGISPRALQAIWQTVFMVVVPNVLGI